LAALSNKTLKTTTKPSKPMQKIKQSLFVERWQKQGLLFQIKNNKKLVMCSSTAYSFTLKNKPIE